jgi:hypothetical protein
MLTFCNSYVLWLLRCVQLRLVTVTFCDINVVWCYVLSQYRSAPIISCSRIGRSIMGISKSLTETWMWKLGLWSRNSFSGNICFKFLVFFLCSVGDLKSQLRASKMWEIWKVSLELQDVRGLKSQLLYVLARYERSEQLPKCLKDVRVLKSHLCLCKM